MCSNHNVENLKFVRDWFSNIDATKGIGEDLFLSISQLTPIINVDLFVKNKHNEILLTWRSDEYYGPGWHVPGGVLRYKETLMERAKKVAINELGLDLCKIYGPKAHHEAFNFTRNIRGHFISFIFMVSIDNNPPKKKQAGKSPNQGEWKWFKKCPDNFINNQNFLKSYFKND
jgi:ADP-ribose pyrophosphatase YjhB (NUDIX family)